MLSLLGTLIMWAFLAGVIAIGLGVIHRRSRGWSSAWRLAAFATILPALVDALMIAIGTTLDPTSHNLWPFELGFMSLIGAGALLVLSLAHGIARRMRADDPAPRSYGRIR